MPEPLPVDVVSTWWDYFVDGVGVLSGLATAGALLYAARTYDRQLELHRRQQASKVTIKVVRDGSTVALEVQNESESPVDGVRWDAATVGDEVGKYEPNRWTGLCGFLGGFERCSPCIQDLPEDVIIGAQIAFRDATGKGWVRYSDGGLHGMSKRFSRDYYEYEVPHVRLITSDAKRRQRRLRNIVARDIRQQFSRH